MRFVAVTFFSFIFLLFSIKSEAQDLGFTPDGINGAAGVGFALFDVQAPDTYNIKIDQGNYIYLGGEKGFGIMNLYLTVSFQNMNTTGQGNYSYSTVSESTVWEVTDADFKANFFQFGLGLKMKFIDGFWFRPYAEAGGLGGYFQIEYTDKSDINDGRVTGSDDDPKMKDSLLDFGSYLEAGAEISFSEEWGLKVSWRYIQSETKKLETLDDRTLRYVSNVYFLSLLKAF